MGKLKRMETLPLTKAPTRLYGVLFHMQYDFPMNGSENANMHTLNQLEGHENHW